MCGIIGYAGKKNCIPIILDGLTLLEYRGYDSAGIAFLKNSKVEIIKEQGNLSKLKEIISNDEVSNLGIGHTRWATHGIPSKENAHPHSVEDITIVHNGIIENYEEIRKSLGNKYNYKSQTDTEVLCALINDLYKQEMDIFKTLLLVKKMVIGSYALGILVNGDNNIYSIRKDSPLIIASSDDGNLIASDVPAILGYTNKYYLLESNEIAVINCDSITFYDDSLNIITKKINEYEGTFALSCKGGYEHFMLKEIHEEHEVIRNTMFPYISNNLISLKEQLLDLSKYEEIDIVGCGSAYYAGLVGKSLLSSVSDIVINNYIASEYRYQKILKGRNKLLIVISQSGETADTLASLRIAKEHGIKTLGIINVFASSIARECDDVIYTKAGCEIAVATTKAYLAQVAVFSLLATRILLNNDELSASKVIDDIKELPAKIEEVVNIDYKSIAKKISEKKDVYLIGRGVDYYISLEGALKLKEISYIHAESYAAGELKHGTIALIDDNTPVIAFASEESLVLKTISNIKEVKSRNADCIYITTKKLDTISDFYDEKVVLPDTNDILKPLLMAIPMQLISYYTAKILGCSIDKPKNLAKSVTVE